MSDGIGGEEIPAAGAVAPAESAGRKRRGGKPPRAFSRFGIEVVRFVSRVYFTLLHGVRYRGLENIPAKGPVIIAPNHVSYYDPMLIGLGVRRRLHSMAWDALFNMRIVGWAMRRLGAFPVDPKAPDTEAYRHSLHILRAGGAVQVFPEGRRGTGREIQPFEQGAARMAIRSGAVVVPATITGALEAWPRWQRRPRPRWRIVVKFHRPIPPPAEHPKGAEIRQAIEDLNRRIAEPIRRRYTAYLRLQRRKGRALPVPPASNGG